MFDLLFPYLAGTVSTAIVVIVATLAYLRNSSSARRYEALERSLPDACRLQNIQLIRERAEEELNALRDELSTAKVTIEQRAQAERWLSDNQQELFSIAAEREEQERVRLQLERLAKQAELESARQIAIGKETLAAELSCAKLLTQEEQLFEQVRALTSQFQQLHAEVADIEKTCAPLRIELAGIRTEITQSQLELQSAQDRCNRSLDAFDRQIKQLENQRDGAQSELKQVQEQVHLARKQLLEIQHLHATLSSEIKGLEALKQSLANQLETLRDDWRYLRVKTGQDEETERQRIAELWQSAIPVVKFRDVQDQDELRRLVKAQSHLRQLGLQFPQRVLWAFHTSLKVTDVSPLVVLAGISGTGKSELPRRYAEAMGLHFLNVAVQPRWDSPQDMFGFFNYLENRYRATELGRALIQMDPFYAEAGRGWRPPENWANNSLSRHLLLVLLDEMNLARVEYYFSEFLSRLEIRRGIRRDNSSDRRNAEIGLEIGASGGHSPVMNVFVDRNVLFVGTMNEDETTQTLSDKVVDRANVLRFGKPGKLEHHATGGNGQLLIERLPFQTWQGWYRPESELDEQTSEQLSNWIARLNDALTRIRRPFAHRTRLAMRTYVANYPGVDPDSVLHAMSDQIEQKILPKLRGFDPGDREFRQTVSDINGVLRELKDELLIDAISSASKGHQFAWMGVDRSQEEVSLAGQ
jgi:Chromosome segregation ATPases